MRVLPLYEAPPLLAIEEAEPLDTNPNCERCPFHENDGQTCMNPEGDPGGILFVSDFPTVGEAKAGVPLIGKSGKAFRSLVERNYDGPYAIDNAFKCLPTKHVIKKNKAKAVKYAAECRGYLADTIEQAQPERIITMGPWAAYSVLGRTLPIYSVRKSYDFMSDGTPVFMLMNPAAVFHNRFIKGWFEEDLIWAINEDPPYNRKGCCRIIETETDARQAWEDLSISPHFVYDCETAGDMYNGDFKVISVALSAQGERDAYVWSDKALANPKCVEYLKRLFIDPNITQCAHNALFDNKAIRIYFGWDIQGKWIDTLDYRRLLAADASGKLEHVQELVGFGGSKEEADYYLTDAIKNCRLKNPKPVPEHKQWCFDAIKTGQCVTPKQYAYGLLPDDVRDRYNALDTVSTSVYLDLAEEQLRDKEKKLYEKLYEPAINAVAQIELWGMYVNPDNLDNFCTYVDTELAEIEKRFSMYSDWTMEAFKQEFNPRSVRHVRHVMFERLGSKPIKFTGGGAPSTDKEVLQALQHSNQLARDMTAHRRIAKLSGSFAHGMEIHVKKDGRIHPSFNISGTETGRLSCNAPNLMAIPRPEDPESKMCRDIFGSEGDDTVIVQLDYSQLELRVAAALSGDEKMKQIFIDGKDYHQGTAELISQVAWGITPEEVEKKHRSFAKQVNFGLVFGMTDEGLAERLGCSVAEARKIRQAVLGTFTKLDRWIKNQLAFGRKYGGVWVPWDDESAKWRPLWKIADDKFGVRNNAENSTFNTPIQGKASYYCLASIPETVRWVIEDRVPRTKVVLTVHDSILFETPRKHVDEVVHCGREIMTQWDSGGVPLVVDAEVGPYWGSLKKYATEKEYYNMASDKREDYWCAAA